MTIKAFGFSLDSAQQTTIEKMCKYITQEEFEVTDLKSFEPEVGTNDIILMYGAKVQRRLERESCLLKVKFPEPYKLNPALNKSADIERTRALKQLNELKEMLASGNMEAISNAEIETSNEKTLNITEELPVQLTAAKVEILERQLLEQNVDYWSGYTVDGKTIRVTVEPEKNTADINLTFAELYAVMGLKEAFRVAKELKIVCKSSDNAKQDSTS